MQKDYKATKAETKRIMEETLDKKCEGCCYNKDKQGGYFCLSCILIGQFLPHKKDENENRTRKI